MLAIGQHIFRMTGRRGVQQYMCEQIFALLGREVALDFSVYAVEYMPAVRCYRTGAAFKSPSCRLQFLESPAPALCLSLSRSERSHPACWEEEAWALELNPPGPMQRQK